MDEVIEFSEGEGICNAVALPIMPSYQFAIQLNKLISQARVHLVLEIQ